MTPWEWARVIGVLAFIAMVAIALLFLSAEDDLLDREVREHERQRRLRKEKKK